MGEVEASGENALLTSEWERLKFYCIAREQKRGSGETGAGERGTGKGTVPIVEQEAERTYLRYEKRGAL